MYPCIICGEMTEVAPNYVGTKAKCRFCLTTTTGTTIKKKRALELPESQDQLDKLVERVMDPDAPHVSEASRKLVEEHNQKRKRGKRASVA
jgi:hypothetical protein